MGRKRKGGDKDGGKRRRSTQVTEAGARIGHLWCAAHAMSQSAPSVSRAYVASARQVGRRLALGLDALTIKRGACKECGTLRVGDGARVRVRARREKKVVVTCGRCGKVRRYLARPVRECKAKGGEDGGKESKSGKRDGERDAGKDDNSDKRENNEESIESVDLRKRGRLVNRVL